MATEYTPVRCRLVRNPEQKNWEDSYTSLGRAFTDRAEAIAWASELLGHDRFYIATVIDGQLAAIGYHMDDFNPFGVGIDGVAAQLGLELHATAPAPHPPLNPW